MAPKLNFIQDTYVNSREIFSKEQRHFLHFRAANFALNLVFGLFLVFGVNSDSNLSWQWQYGISIMAAILMIFGGWKAFAIWMDLWTNSVEKIHGEIVKLEKVQRRGPPHYYVHFESIKLRALNKKLWEYMELNQRYVAYYTKRSRFLISARVTS